MVQRILAVLALVFGLTAVALAEPPGDSDALETATAFCAARVADSEGDLEGLITASLADKIDKALARNATVQAATPNEKPPLGDGIPWQGFPDRAEVCEPGEAKVSGNAVRVDIHYRFPGQTGGDWTDTLVVVAEEGEARIDDVLYPTFANDTYRTGLRRVLFDSFDP